MTRLHTSDHTPIIADPRLNGLGTGHNQPTAKRPEMSPCPICASAAIRALPVRHESHLVLCRGCGCMYRPDRPSLAEAAELLRGEAGARHYTEVIDLAASGTTMKARAAAIAEWTRGLWGEGALLLELATADTTVLAPLRPLLPAGVRVRGVELHALCKDGLEAPASERVGDAWVQRPARAELHDVVLMPYVLQRLPDFVAALALARAALRPGGALYLSCSNLLAPHPKKRLRTWLGSQRWGCLSLGHLEAVLARAGFAVERATADADLRVLARPALPAQPTVASEQARVLGALLWHEVLYWPPYVAARVKNRVRA